MHFHQHSGSFRSLSKKTLASIADTIKSHYEVPLWSQHVDLWAQTSTSETGKSHWAQGLVSRVDGQPDSSPNIEQQLELHKTGEVVHCLAGARFHGWSCRWAVFSAEDKLGCARDLHGTIQSLCDLSQPTTAPKHLGGPKRTIKDILLERRHLKLWRTRRRGLLPHHAILLELRLSNATKTRPDSPGAAERQHPAPALIKKLLTGLHSSLLLFWNQYLWHLPGTHLAHTEIAVQNFVGCFNANVNTVRDVLECRPSHQLLHMLNCGWISGC